MKYLLNWNPSGHFLLKDSYQHRKPSQGWQHAPFLTLEGRQAVPRSFLDWVQSNRLQPRKPALAKMEITLRPAISSSPRRRPTLCGLQARSPPCRYTSYGSRSEGPFSHCISVSVQLAIPDAQPPQQLHLEFAQVFSVAPGIFGGTHPAVLKGTE